MRTIELTAPVTAHVSKYRDLVDVVIEVQPSRGIPARHVAFPFHQKTPASFWLDESFQPVPIRPRQWRITRRFFPQREASNLLFRGLMTAADIPMLEGQPQIVKVWRDTKVRPLAAGPTFPCECVIDVARGDISDVAAYLQVTEIWTKGYRGKGIAIAVVDGGINAIGKTAAGRESPRIQHVVDGWPGDWGTTSGNWEEHGNMAAFDVLGMAPDASIYDVRVSGPHGTRDTMSAVISEATAGFQWCIERFRQDGTPHIITCSWGMMQSSWDQEYARDPGHFFTRKVEEALDEGIIVLFAAGNCGSVCGLPACGGDRGPGKSIWGANGHPDVITVGAATIEEKLAGYSSQGPASLDPKKPDFCGITHFTGFTNCDNGTSASTPITAGVVALLKEKKPGLTQREAKKILQETAKAIVFRGWNPHFGYGIIRPKEAFNRL